MYYNPTWTPSPMTTASSVHHNQHIVEVLGEGTVSAAPNKAVIVLGTITETPSLEAAQKENANAITNVINSLVKLSVPKENIQTVNYRIETQYDYEAGKQIFRGYKVTHLLQVATDKVDQTGLIVDTAVANGANTVSNIQFTVAHPEAYYNQALTLAIRDGQQKALTIAKTLGVTLNRIPSRIQEVTRALEPVPREISLFAASAITPIQPGELKISASIKAKYSYF